MGSKDVAVTLGSNIASLSAQRRLGEASSSLSKTFERLSSGMRINHASDDAAGLAIATGLDSQARIYTVAQRNVSDTVSAVSIASDAAKSLTDITIRQRELATQAANGVFSSPQRDAMNQEAGELTNEYNRIIGTTSFNGIKLVTNPWDTLTTQLGEGAQATISYKFADALATKLTPGSYFILDGVDENYVWFTIDGQGSDPAPFDPSKGIRVDTLSSAPTPKDIGQAVATALTASGKYSVQNGASDGELIVTNLTAGLSTATTDVNTGIVLTDIINSGSAGDGSGVGSGTFGATTNYGVGSTPWGAATLADLNGDGLPDIVQSNYFGGTVSVLLNQENGTFGAETEYGVGSSPQSAATLADLNGDGRPDIVQSNYGGGTVSVLLNQGDGTFGASTDYTVGSYPQGAATLADLNGDGRPDIVQSNHNSGTVSVLLNQGNGTFGASTDYTVGSGPQSAATLADLNGDGRPDIVQSNSLGSSVSVLLNQGNGTFGASTDYTVGSGPAGAATLADLNGDGRPDIVQSNYGSDTVSVLLNQGGGTPVNATPAVTRLIFGDARGMTQVNQVNLTTQQLARDSMSMLDSRLDRLSAQQGVFGSMESRLAAASQVISASIENFRAAESRITDVDIAQESANLVRLQILQRGAATVLAQANQQPLVALQLLHSV